MPRGHFQAISAQLPNDERQNPLRSAKRRTINFEYKVIPKEADYAGSKEIAEANGGRLITLQELVSNQELLPRLEGKWSWLADKGTELTLGQKSRRTQSE